MGELTIAGVADSWSDGPDYKWQCGEERPCWAPIAATAEQALSEGTRYGCKHDGRVVMRHRTVVVGPWREGGV